MEAFGDSSKSPLAHFFLHIFFILPFTFALIPSIFYWVYFTSWTQVVEHDEATIAENLIYENNWGVPAPLCIAD